MIANYGYKDGSGDFFIAIDMDRCNGFGACVKAYPASFFMVDEDENDLPNDQPVANRPLLPCMAVCEPGAINHNW
jgi:ferredoxin